MDKKQLPPPLQALATALKREHETGVTILAQGRGSGVEPLLRLAQVHEIPVIQDFTLSHKLSTLPPGAVIPDSIFKALTTVLDFIFVLEYEQKALNDMPAENKSVKVNEASAGLPVAVPDLVRKLL